MAVSRMSLPAMGRSSSRMLIFVGGTGQIGMVVVAQM